MSCGAKRANRALRLIPIGVFAGAVVGCLACYYVLTDVVTAELTPLSVAAGQRVVGGIVLAALMVGARLLRSDAQTLRPTRTQRFWLTMLSLTNVPLMACLVGGFVYSSATNAALIERLDLPLALLFGHLLLGQRATRVDWALVVPLIAAVLMVLEVSPAHWKPHWIGDLMFFAATAMAVGNAVLIRRYLAGVRSWAIARWNLGLSGIWLTLLLLLIGGREGLLPLLTSPQSAVIVAVLGILGIFELTAYYALLGRMSVWYVRCIMLLVPLVTVLIESARSAVSLRPVQWVGGALMLGCLLVMILRHIPRRWAPRGASFDVERCT